MDPPAPHLVDEILDEIFLHLRTPEELARAPTACPRFFRIITEGSFLRRYRKLHPPPLLGFVADKGGFHPAQEPHPSAPLARSLTNATDFTYSFVPKPNNGLLTPWYARDIRDGRVLLECSCRLDNEAVFTNLTVCDPLSKRYVLLPPIPEEITVQQERPGQFKPMLAPIGQNEDEDETSFKVICTAHYKSNLVAFAFSSVTGQWSMAASPSWGSLGTVEPTWKCLSRFNYLRGCFYWPALLRSNLKLLVLDTRIMEFSTVDIRTGYHLQLINQPGRNVCMSTIVDATKGALEMFTLVGDYNPTSFHLYHTTLQNNGESSSEWQQKNVMDCLTDISMSQLVQLRDSYSFEGFEKLSGIIIHMGCCPRITVLIFFSLEVNTFELKKVCRATYYEAAYRVHSYFGFPPSLSKPSL